MRRKGAPNVRDPCRPASPCRHRGNHGHLPREGVDLEGTASVMVAHAMTRSDLVIIPTKGSELDAIEALKVIQFIARQERAYSSSMPTRTNRSSDGAKNRASHKT